MSCRHRKAWFVATCTIKENQSLIRYSGTKNAQSGLIASMTCKVFDPKQVAL